MLQTIEILVSPRGETTLETKGFAGNSCRDASRHLEEALGNAHSERLTSEFYAQFTAVQQVQQDGAR